MIDVTVVIPCLNEEKSIATCIKKAKEAFGRLNISGEIIVVDNGSSDKSVEIAKNAGATVLDEPNKGYGSALRRGIEAANGKYIIMADGDNTYDLREIDKFIKKLNEGFDLVMGSRFKGIILPGAMTWPHRYIGNPILSGMLRLFFGGSISDAHCGLRAFTKEAYNKMDLHTVGMEFASEMVIHALKKKLKTAEVPINYFPRQGESKLDSFRDAWRHIRFMLIYSPSYVFIFPGIAIFLPCFIITTRLVYGPINVFGRYWDIHPMVIFSMFTLLGWQILNLGYAAKVFAATISLEEDKWIGTLSKKFSLERAILLGIGLILFGFLIIAYIFFVWYQNNFGALKEISTGVFALTITVMGFQTIFTAFLTSMFQIKYR